MGPVTQEGLIRLNQTGQFTHLTFNFLWIKLLKLNSLAFFSGIIEDCSCYIAVTIADRCGSYCRNLFLATAIHFK